MERKKSAIFTFGLVVIFIHIFALILIYQEYVKSGFILIIIGILCDTLLYKLIKLDNVGKTLEIRLNNTLKISMVGALAFSFHMASLLVLYNENVFLGLSLGLIGILYDVILYFCIDADNKKVLQEPKKAYNWQIILLTGFFVFMIHIATMIAIPTFGVTTGLILGKMSILSDIILFLLIKANNEGKIAIATSRTKQN